MTQRTTDGRKRLKVRLSRRFGARWEKTVLTRPEDPVHLPTCGLDCRLADLYRGTPLLRDGSGR